VSRRVAEKEKEFIAVRTKVGQFYDLEDCDSKFNYGEWWN